MTILEGESLLNDATALTIYSIALAVAAGGVFSPSGAILRFAGAILGGVVIGVAVGWIVAHLRARIEDTPVEMTISLLTPYAAFLPADRLDASGVIATVAAGLYLGHRGSRIMGADARLTGRALWETITFLLNGFVFIVMGLEIPLLFRTLTPALALAADRDRRRRDPAAGARPRPVDPRHGLPAPAAAGPARRPGVLARPVLGRDARRGLAGRRAGAPADASGGRPFPAREALVIVTLTVIVLTLVGQGLTLPSLIRALRLGTDQGLRAEEARARQHLLEAATRRLDELYRVWPGHRPLLDELRQTYRHRSEHVERQRDAPEGSAEDQELIEHREIRQTIIGAEREALLRLRAEEEVSDEVLRELERELDLEERRMDA